MSRIWIYQAERALTDQELSTANEVMLRFVSDWKAHGAPLNASFEIKHHLFLILKVNEEMVEATGCSIDASVHQFKELEKQLGVKLFNRQRVAFVNNGAVTNCSLQEFKQLLADGIVNEETLVFNNSISKAEELNTQWQLPAAQSWLSRFFG